MIHMILNKNIFTPSFQGCENSFDIDFRFKNSVCQLGREFQSSQHLTEVPSNDERKKHHEGQQKYCDHAIYYLLQKFKPGIFQGIFNLKKTAKTCLAKVTHFHHI